MTNKGVSIGRHINGITVNPLDENGEVKFFEDECAAKVYLAEQGYADTDMYWMVFAEEKLLETLLQSLKEVS